MNDTTGALKVYQLGEHQGIETTTDEQVDYQEVRDEKPEADLEASPQPQLGDGRSSAINYTQRRGKTGGASVQGSLGH